MHVRKGLQDLAPLVLGPHHEGIHGALDVVVVPGFGEMPRACEEGTVVRATSLGGSNWRLGKCMAGESISSNYY